ncbi:MAG: metal-dependent transcriptional regulator [Candidatus Kariarchaeaceae archaeon]
MMDKEIISGLENLSETTENYLKRIYFLTSKKKQARMSEIAKSMNRSLSSVTEAVQRLAKEGFLNYEKYGKVTFTLRGEEIAKNIHENFSLMNDLLQTLGIPEDTSIIDACAMEHDISETTMDTISEFIGFIKDDPEASQMMKKFKARLK